jgi:hypothetical protein
MLSALVIGDRMIFCQYIRPVARRLEQGLIIQGRVFAGVFIALHSDADARCFGHSAFAARGAELRSFAAKNCQTVEDDRRKIQRAVKSLGGNPRPLDCTE